MEANPSHPKHPSAQEIAREVADSLKKVYPESSEVVSQKEIQDHLDFFRRYLERQPKESEPHYQLRMLALEAAIKDVASELGISPEKIRAFITGSEKSFSEVNAIFSPTETLPKVLTPKEKIPTQKEQKLLQNLKELQVDVVGDRISFPNGYEIKLPGMHWKVLQKGPFIVLRPAGVGDISTFASYLEHLKAYDIEEEVQNIQKEFGNWEIQIDPKGKRVRFISPKKGVFYETPLNTLNDKWFYSLFATKESFTPKSLQGLKKLFPSRDIPKKLSYYYVQPEKNIFLGEEILGMVNPEGEIFLNPKTLAEMDQQLYRNPVLDKLYPKSKTAPGALQTTLAHEAMHKILFEKGFMGNEKENAFAKLPEIAAFIKNNTQAHEFLGFAAGVLTNPRDFFGALENEDGPSYNGQALFAAKVLEDILKRKNPNFDYKKDFLDALPENFSSTEVGTLAHELGLREKDFSRIQEAYEKTAKTMLRHLGLIP